MAVMQRTPGLTQVCDLKILALTPKSGGLSAHLHFASYLARERGL